jgi:hypothetical protein
MEGPKRKNGSGMALGSKKLAMYYCDKENYMKTK